MNRISAADADSRHRWTVIRNLLHSTTPDILSVEDCRQRCRMLADLCVHKVRAVKSKIASTLGQPADPLYVDKRHYGEHLHEVTPTVDEVGKVITSMPAKSSNGRHSDSTT